MALSNIYSRPAPMGFSESTRRRQNSVDDGTVFDLSTPPSTPGAEAAHPRLIASAQQTTQATLRSKVRLVIFPDDRPTVSILDTVLNDQIIASLETAGVHVPFKDENLDLVHFWAWLHLTKPDQEIFHITRSISLVLQGIMSLDDQPLISIANDPIFWHHSPSILGCVVEARVRLRPYLTDRWPDDVNGVFDCDFVSQSYSILEWNFGVCKLRNCAGRQRDTLIRFDVKEVMTPGIICLMLS